MGQFPEASNFACFMSLFQKKIEAYCGQHDELALFFQLFLRYQGLYNIISVHFVHCNYTVIRKIKAN